MRIGDVTIHSVFDGVMPLPPGLLYPDVPASVWQELGCPLGSVTDVVLTHLHIDHVGWASTDGRATFPGARHHIHAVDWKHFVDGDADDLVRRKVVPLREAAVFWDGPETAPFE